MLDFATAASLRIPCILCKRPGGAGDRQCGGASHRREPSQDVEDSGARQEGTELNEEGRYCVLAKRTRTPDRRLETISAQTFQNRSKKMTAGPGRDLYLGCGTIGLSGLPASCLVRVVSPF
jgi:hypothetical protein